MSFECALCGRFYEKPAPACKCGGKGTLELSARPHLVTRATRPQRASSHRSAHVPKHSTGIPEWDEALGGGIVRSILIGGWPGTGKTTWAMKAAGEIATALRGDALYLSSEMPESMVVAAGKRSGANLDRILVWNVQNTLEAAKECRKLRPKCVVWDSIQAFDLDVFEVAREAVSASFNLPLLLVCQSTKDGDFNGPEGLLHLVDATMWLEKNDVTVMKNRFAPAPKEVKFKRPGDAPSARQDETSTPSATQDKPRRRFDLIRRPTA